MLLFVMLVFSCRTRDELTATQDIVTQVAKLSDTKLSFSYTSTNGVKKIRIQFLTKPESENQIGEILLNFYKQSQKKKIEYSFYSVADEQNRELLSCERKRLQQLNEKEALVLKYVLDLKNPSTNDFDKYFIIKNFKPNELQYVSDKIGQMHDPIIFKGFFERKIGPINFIVFQYNSGDNDIFITLDEQQQKIAGFDSNF
ncbi:MAG: hypothetical protein ACK46O_06125 [Flavobacteriia bacterium]